MHLKISFIIQRSLFNMTKTVTDLIAIVVVIGITYRVIDVSHLQEILGTAIFLHLNGLPAPLH